MKPRTFVPGIVAACATAFLTAGLLAQQTPGEKKQPQTPAPKPAKPDHPEHPKPAAQPSPEEAAFMEAWAKYATPGASHTQLAKKAGKWTVNGKMWMAPGSEPQEFGGTSTLAMDLDGHYLVENVEGSEVDPITGQTFKGRAWIAYDNLTSKIVTVWIDNMGTGITRFTGSPNADWTTITLTGESPDFVTGKYKTVKSVERKISDSQFVVTMFDKGPDGKEYTSMELTYNRAGGSAQPASKTVAPAAPAKRPGG
jgi:hypothetical protein